MEKEIYRGEWIGVDRFAKFTRFVEDFGTKFPHYSRHDIRGEDNGSKGTIVWGIADRLYLMLHYEMRGVHTNYKLAVGANGDRSLEKAVLEGMRKINGEILEPSSREDNSQTRYESVRNTEAIAAMP